MSEPHLCALVLLSQAHFSSADGLSTVVGQCRARCDEVPRCFVVLTAFPADLRVRSLRVEEMVPDEGVARHELHHGADVPAGHFHKGLAVLANFDPNIYDR